MAVARQHKAAIESSKRVDSKTFYFFKSIWQFNPILGGGEREGLLKPPFFSSRHQTPGATELLNLSDFVGKLIAHIVAIFFRRVLLGQVTRADHVTRSVFEV